MFTLIKLVVWPFYSESRKPLLLFLLGLLAVVATGLSHVSTPWLVGRLIDAAPHSDVAGLRTSVIGLFGAALLASLGGGTRSVVGRHLADLFRAHLRTRLMERVLALPLSSLEGHESRYLNSVFIDDVPTVSSLANPMALNLFLAIIQLIGALSILIVRFGSFAWLVLLVVPLNVFISIWQLPIARAKAREQQGNKTDLDSLTIEVVEGARDIKSLAAASVVMTRMAALTDTDLYSRLQTYLIGTIDHARYAASWLVMSVVYLIAGLAVVRGELTIGSLTAFVFYVGFLETPISRIWQLVGEWQSIRVSLERYSRTISLDAESEGLLVLTTDVEPEIEIRQVSFRYPGSTNPALSQVALRFGAAEEVGIVGVSGAGKTTLVSLMLRLFDPTEGAVLINGIDIRQYTLASLRRYVAIISQEPFIFDGTVRDNIRFGVEDSTDSDIEWAASVADADAFIRDMADGYDTVLGARGTRLSGGQKRRLAIARAIIRRPRLLILDEVTGALDSTSDAAIQRSISLMGKRCTTLVISHRLSSTSHAKKIFVLERGCVINAGTHQILLHECPSYRTLVQLQELEQFVEGGTVVRELNVSTSNASMSPSSVERTATAAVVRQS